MSHAGSAFYPSPYHEAAILTIDGVGEWATASVGHGKWKRYQDTERTEISSFSRIIIFCLYYYLGFKVNSGEYKFMGLAPYGNPSIRQVKKYISDIKEKLIDIKDDGSGMA